MRVFYKLAVPCKLFMHIQYFILFLIFSKAVKSSLISDTKFDAMTLEEGRIYSADVKDMSRSRYAGPINWCKQLGWKAVPGPVTALASFPGSGNTWLRYLLQQATGL